MIWPWILLKPRKSLARSFRITGSGYYFSSSPITNRRQWPDRPARSRALAIAPCRFSYLCWNLTQIRILDDFSTSFRPSRFSCERDCVSGDNSVAFYVPLLEYAHSHLLWLLLSRQKRSVSLEPWFQSI